MKWPVVLLPWVLVTNCGYMWTNILKPSWKCYLGKVLRYLVFKKVRASSTKIFVGSCLIAAMSSFSHTICTKTFLCILIFLVIWHCGHIACCSESCFIVLVVLTGVPSVLLLDLALSSQEQINWMRDINWKSNVCSNIVEEHGFHSRNNPVFDGLHEVSPNITVASV